MDTKVYLGGIVGNNDGIIKNCTNESDILGVGCIGGIAAENNRIITNCTNKGIIRYLNRDNIGKRIGGIVGYACLGDVSDCVNKEDIRFENSEANDSTCI